MSSSGLEAGAGAGAAGAGAAGTGTAIAASLLLFTKSGQEVSVLRSKIKKEEDHHKQIAAIADKQARTRRPRGPAQEDHARIQFPKTKEEKEKGQGECGCCYQIEVKG